MSSGGNSQTGYPKNCHRKYSNTVLYRSLFSRFIHAQPMELLLVTENSEHWIQTKTILWVSILQSLASFSENEGFRSDMT